MSTLCKALTDNKAFGFSLRHLDLSGNPGTLAGDDISVSMRAVRGGVTSLRFCPQCGLDGFGLLWSVPCSTPGMGMSWLQHPKPAWGHAGDIPLHLPGGMWEMPSEARMYPMREWVPVCTIHPCAQQEGGHRLELRFQGCGVLGGGWDSGANLLSPLCSQNLQSLLRHCHSLSHLSLAGTDCPLDAVSTVQGVLALSPALSPPPSPAL